MNRHVLRLFLFVIPLQLCAAISFAEYPYVNFSTLQAVNAYGNSTYSGGGSISLIGVVINNPRDMSDYNNYYFSGPYNATWWQTFIQALPGETYGGVTWDINDFGGAALYMRVNNPSNSSMYYTEAQWTSEMNRVNCVSGSTTLSYGDVVRVQANAPGMFFRGKFNINEKHQTAPEYDFSVEIIGHTTPQAANITLADLVNPDGSFIFDQTRATGCERYQGTLVHLDNLYLASGSTASWALDGTVTVRQEERTFQMKLGLDEGLNLSADILQRMTTNPFSVTAILDQEDPGTKVYDDDGVPIATAYWGGYRLWLTNASMLTGVTIPEPASIILLLTALSTMLLAWWRKKQR